MAITRVELNADRLRRRRDNSKLRASNRDKRLTDGDTLANAAAETQQTPRPNVANPDSDKDAPMSESHSPQSIRRQRIDAQDSQLYDLKAVFSGTNTSPSHPSQTPEKTSDRPHAVHARKADASPIDSALTNPTQPADESNSNGDLNATQTESAPTDQPIGVERGLHMHFTPDTNVRREAHAHEHADDHSHDASTTNDPKVGQSRLDLITGEWTWFATTRSQRPDQFGNVVVKPTADIDCPFCAGEEHRTPNPVWVASVDNDDNPHNTPAIQQSGDASDWSVRVVPNLYPAVSRLEDAGVAIPPNQDANDQRAEKEAMPASARRHRSSGAFTSCSHAQAIYKQHSALNKRSDSSKLFPSEAAMGGHEVIIEAPRHTESLGELNTSEIALVFTAYADRIRYWRSVPGVQHVSIFKNVGRDAGASLQHSHSQLIATNRVPAVVQQVTRRLQAHHARNGSCLQCDLIRSELEDKTRIVSQTDSFVAYCPFASRFPMQVRLTSKEHMPCFSQLHERPLAELARLALRVVRWLEALRPQTAYNMLVHTCPVNFQGAMESQHWAIDIFPRISRLAGFELATGAMINPIYPETAAKAYRAQARLSDPRYVLR
ncbi:galactose-1-phosphate uridylyltransferase [Rhodopirellula sallentina]|uniref:Galactose-1-phosphate uridylyltransferase n=1 Tax=Rhodopirellula sallentina SM41 TaxID=1263870 RepID=M5TX19_9BACT|nr:DUF4921 family protein [Rhodopirellula sallentina]EMI53710.1 galactose-1-phosphate uridylyltransferase [Rhodopirellula sallentina SM41]